MKLVINVNVVTAALIADSNTHEQTLEMPINS